MQVSLSVKQFQAVIFDMDGVLTDTAGVHAAAWKQLFDPFLKERAKRADLPFLPFDKNADYLHYVDGKPRYEGIQSFLQSRDIEIPFGTPEDSGDVATVCGMGNKKNALFLQQLAKEGVEIFQTTLDLVKGLRERGVKTAIISSSKNATAILQRIGVLDLFDVKIDGNDSAALNLKGKPDPAIFVEAAKLLEVSPERAVVVEDAISGVQAGKKGGFGLVIGVDRDALVQALLQNGADVVVRDLEEVVITGATEEKPNALQSKEELTLLFSQYQKLAIFLDYDGTLTPIVSHPDLAVLAEGMKKTLRELAEIYPVAIISGRDRVNVQKFVGIEGLYYAGSHGFDISGPGGAHTELEKGVSFLPILDEVEHELKSSLKGIEGLLIERKKYAIAVHYRQVDPSQVKALEERVHAIHHHNPDLRFTCGKMIFELQPNIDWNKGKALLWLLQLLHLDRKDVLPVYLGDDVTDEDAFQVLLKRGLGIAIQETRRATAARFTLKGPEEVQEFFQWLIARKELV